MKINSILTIVLAAAIFTSCAGDAQRDAEIAKAKAEASASNYTLKAEPVAEFKSQRPAEEER